MMSLSVQVCRSVHIWFALPFILLLGYMLHVALKVAHSDGDGADVYCLLFRKKLRYTAEFFENHRRKGTEFGLL